MWFFTLLPDVFLRYIADLGLIAGILSLGAGVFAWRSVLLKPYGSGLKVIGIILLCSGSFLKGISSADAEYQRQIAAMEARVKAAEVAAIAANNTIETRIIERVEKVTVDTSRIDQQLESIRKEINRGCEFDPTFVDEYNRIIRRGRDNE